MDFNIAQLSGESFFIITALKSCRQTVKTTKDSKIQVHVRSFFYCFIKYTNKQT